MRLRRTAGWLRGFSVWDALIMRGLGATGAVLLHKDTHNHTGAGEGGQLTKAALSDAGSANGLATLGVDGKLTSTQVPAIDHGTLSGLADDDHTGYVRLGGDAARNATATTLAELDSRKINRVYYALDYATWDGVTDDTAALNALFTTAAAEGALVILPPLTAIVDGLTLPSTSTGYEVRGVPGVTTFKSPAGKVSATPVVQTQPYADSNDSIFCDYVRVGGFVVDMNNVSANPGLAIYHVRYSHWHDIVVKNGNAGAMVIVGNLGTALDTVNMPRNVFERFKTTGNQSNGDQFIVNGQERSVIRDIEISGGGLLSSAMTMSAGRGNLFEDIYVHDQSATSRGLTTEPGASTTIDELTFRRVRVVGTGSTYGGGLSFNSLANQVSGSITVEDCELSNCGDGLVARFVQGLRIIDTDAHGNYTHGFNVDKCSEVIVSGCRAYNNSKSGAGTYGGFTFQTSGEGGSLVTLERVNMVNCQAWDDQGTPTQGYGVWLNSDITGHAVFANVSCWDNVTSQWNVAATQTAARYVNCPGKREFSVVSKTGAYTVTETDDLVLVDATSAPVTITLPSAATRSRPVSVKKTDSSANAVTVSGAGNIDGAASKSLASQNDAVRVAPDGTDWWVI